MKKKILLLLFICNLMTISAIAQIRYVKPGGTGNGSSWANASGSIQDMIDYTFSGGQVWIAAGAYNLSVTLQIKDGVNVYGGFLGNETSIADRQKSDLDDNGTIEPWEFTYATVLNGQNAVQVLNQAADFSMETVWDGVTITNGKASGNGGGACIRANCILINSIISNNAIINYNGGGICNLGGTVSSCIVRNNTASYYGGGGGMYNSGTVSNCIIRNNTASNSGGGIYNSGTIRNCTVSNNTVTGSGASSYSGGGIYNVNVSSIVSNCIVSDNTISGSTNVTYGGGIYQGTIDHCTVNNNSASSGGGIYGSDSISNCTVKGNSSTSNGGGIYSSNNNVVISNCIVSENIASRSSGSVYGGGIYCSGSNGTISHCTINGNTASNSTTSTSYSAYGGGVAINNTTAKIIDCIIKDNKTLKNGVQDGRGGGIYQGIITRCRIEDNSSGEGGGFYGSSANNCLLLNNSAATNGGGGFLVANGNNINCTFVGNTASRGGGIYFNTNTGTSATNCIFWQNYAQMWEQVGTPSGASAANVAYSAIQEQYPGVGNIIIAEENENGGPLFLNPAAQNYYLQENSPCINTGSNAALSVADTTDLAGNTRIYAGTVDMGAYERIGINPPTYTISGQVTYNGNPLEDVMMIHAGDSSVFTNESGEYIITVYQGTNITITPAMEGYGFTPVSITCNNVASNFENEDFTAIAMVSVTNITNIPDTILPNVPYMLVGTVLPSNASRQTIVWSVANAGTTGATITGDTLTTTAVGTLVVTATIIDGITLGVNYVQNFTIITNSFCGGSGTSTDPYQICTHQQLNALAIYINVGNGNATSGKYYKLMNDIDLSSYDNWAPIGNNNVNNNTHRFQGNFDGNEKVVHNLTISTPSDYQGLFGYTNGGTIQNLGIENCNINGRYYTGGLVGYNTAAISNSYVTGYVKGDDYTGGFAGYNASTITNCYAMVNVNGSNTAGGLVGHNTSTISNSYAGGNVNAIYDYVGGLVGVSTGTIRNCIAANDSVITAAENVSNISRVCGYQTGTFRNNYALGIMIVLRGANIGGYDDFYRRLGTSLSPAMLKSFSFYNTTSSWDGDSPTWSIADPSGIWAICDGEGLPFLRWQEITCNGVEEIFCGGSGTLEDPYQICTHQQLKNLADYVNAGNGDLTSDKYYKLMSDIDLISYANWIPIGNISSSSLMRTFQGDFDGNGKIVRNLTITGTSAYQGLFGYVMGAKIRNLGIENCNITGDYSVGSLVGKVDERSSVRPDISNCYATGSVNGTGNFVGGLVGAFGSNYGNLVNCYATVNVSGYAYVGGLVGYSIGNYIRNCYATGTVRGAEKVGGLVGHYGYTGAGNVSNVIAANDSVIATEYTTAVNRVFGSTESDGDKVYALNTMVVQRDNTTITVTNNTATSGTAQSLATLKSLSFYTTSSNWHNGQWSITDPSGIWQICNGERLPFLRWQGLACGSFVPVTNITGVPTATTVTVPLVLIGTVLPSNATNRAITWSVQNAGTTGATITGNTLNTTAPGTVTVRATITNGTAVGANYTQNFNITVSKAVLGGTVSITGSTVFGETLTAVTSALTSTPTVSLGTLSYQWKRGSTNIGTNSVTYTLVEADINQTITVTVSAENCTGNVTSAATAVVTKAPQTAPALPTLSSSTATSITLNEVSGCEYNINSGIWQSSSIFEGLTPNTSYTFTQRKKETTTHSASPASASATFNTDNTTLPLYTIDASVNNSAFGTITPYGETQVEEGNNITFNITPFSNYVIDSVLVNGVSQGRINTYTFTNVQANGSIAVVFKRGAEIAVLGGTVTITGSAVFGQTLTAVTSALTSTPTVSLGTLSYQWKRGSTNIGTNNATYTLAEADINQTITVTVSAENCTGNVTSAATAVVTKAPQTAPALPTLSSSTATSITLNEVSGCEYNINSGIWQSSSVFEGLTPNTSYSFTQRKKETATHSASPASAPATFGTDNTTLPLYTIVASVNNSAFGTITPYGETQVEEGNDITFNITPFSDYIIDSVLVNGVSQGRIDTYTFTNVQSNGSIAVAFVRSVGIDKIELSGISVYPNPARDELRITSDKMQVTSIEFFDVIGKKVFTPTVSQRSSEIVINISHLQAGVYFMRISTKGGETIKKVVKE